MGAIQEGDAGRVVVEGRRVVGRGSRRRRPSPPRGPRARRARSRPRRRTWGRAAPPPRPPCARKSACIQHLSPLFCPPAKSAGAYSRRGCPLRQLRRGRGKPRNSPGHRKLSALAPPGLRRRQEKGARAGAGGKEEGAVPKLGQAAPDVREGRHTARRLTASTVRSSCRGAPSVCRSTAAKRLSTASDTGTSRGHRPPARRCGEVLN